MAILIPDAVNRVIPNAHNVLMDQPTICAGLVPKDFIWKVYKILEMLKLYK